MTSPGASVRSVSRPSPAASAGIRRGDRIITCNGIPVKDWVDILALGSGKSEMDLMLKRGLSRRTVHLRRRPGSEWGLEIAGSSARVCRNRCIFCFVDQQPPGLRESLALKDDDVRFSFLEGTYITLTDTQTDEAIERGFNSLHVSVQATDPVLRGRLLGHRSPMPVLHNIDRLAAKGISVQAQVVEIPHWNDGDVLEQTISDLWSRENVQILGIVPVGLTRWREGLEALRRPDRVQAAATLSTIEKWQQKAMKERGRPWVFAGDEYYILAEQEFPPGEFYRTCTLHANGIGLIPVMLEQCSGKTYTGRGTVVTGELAAPLISGILKGSNYRVTAVPNRLLGASVGVAGLLSGADVIDAVKREGFEEDVIYLPSAMFNHQGVTLDEFTAEEIGKRLDMTAVVLDTPGDLV